MNTTKFQRLEFVLVVLCLVAISCGINGQAAQSQPYAVSGPQATNAYPADTNQAAGSGSGQTASGNSTIGADIWSRRDIPPSEVINQIQIASPGGAGGGGRPCFFLGEGQNGSTPSLVVTNSADATGTLQINETGFLCLLGFAPNQSINILVDRPDGTTRSFTTTSMQTGDANFGEVDITPLPGDPIGMYKLTATSGTVEAEGSYTVNPASSLTIGDTGGFGDGRATVAWINRGDTLLVPLAGFPANSSVRFILYMFSNEIELPKGHPSCKFDCTAREVHFVTSWNSNIDDRGELAQKIETSMDTPTTEYLLLITGPNAPTCKFYFPFLSNKGFDWSSTSCYAVMDIVIQ